MADKIKKPIQQLQQLRRLSYNVQARESARSGSQTSARAPALEEMQLEKVIGTSSKGSNSLQVNPANGDICYLAGSHLVLYSPRDAKQIKFLSSRTSRPFQCVRFSADGKYLAAGESAFKLPQITIWEITYEETEQTKAITPADNQSMASQEAGQEASADKTMVKTAIKYDEIKHLKGHKYGIEAVLFSPKNDFLISLGDPNDRGLFVWDWRNETKISQNKLSKPVLILEISPKQDFFVTGGYQHLKYWYLDEETGQPITRKINDKSPAILESQSADLTKVKQQIFVGISILGPKVFVLANDGHIYVYDKQRKLLKWMNIKVPRAFSCSAQEGRLYCSCADGTIRVFSTETLQHLLSLSKPPPLGSTNLLAGNGRIKIQQNKQTKFADVLATAIDHLNNRAVALYSDRMMFVWDVAELKSVTVLRSMYSHSGPIHDIQAVSNKYPIGLNQKPTSLMRCQDEENLTKFVTCSSDRTIRFWNSIDPTIKPAKYQEIYQCLAKNAYSKDMSHMIFVTSKLRESQDPTDENPKTPYDHFKAGKLDRQEDGTPVQQLAQSLNVDDMDEMVDSIRCINVSPDGTHLASGDEVGNVRIHNLVQNELPQVKFLESHDNEVISLAFSSQMPVTEEQKSRDSSDVPSKRYLLASGGRDKQVHLYDSRDSYEPFASLDHHTSTITALQFNNYSSVEGDKRLSGAPEYEQQVDLISTSADRNLINKKLDLEKFKRHSDELDVAGQDFENPLFKLTKTEICKDKILSMDVASQAQYLITGHDKSLSLWKLPTFEKVWEKRVATIEKEEQKTGQKGGTNQVQLRVLIDDYASVVVSSSTSKRVTIYEAATGMPLCRAQPGQITTAMCFSNNMKHLITTSDNGLIFIWRLPEKMSQCLQQIKNEAARLELAIMRTPTVIEEAEENEELGDSSGPKKLSVRGKSPMKKTGDNDEGDEDFSFDVPSNLKPSDRDNTIVKKRKEEVVDVLADIAKATSFVDEIVKKETPMLNKKKAESLQIKRIESDDQGATADGDEPEDAKRDSAKEEESKKGFHQKAPSVLEVQGLDANLSDGQSDTHSVAAGEIEAPDANPDETECELLKQIQRRQYQQRFANFADDEDENRNQFMRRSSEIWGRKSITQKMMMRRSSTFVPGQTNLQVGSGQVSSSLVSKESENYSQQRTVTECGERPQLFDKVEREGFVSEPLSAGVKVKDEVTDITDDKEIMNWKPKVVAPVKTEQQKVPEQPNNSLIGMQGKPLVVINDFEASLENQNKNAKLIPSPKKPEAPSTGQLAPRQTRSTWNTGSKESDPLKSDVKNDVQFNKFAGTGKPLDTRPTFVMKQDPKVKERQTEPVQGSRPIVEESKKEPRQKSPVKRMVDKMFGRSPDKKKIGTSQIIDVNNQATNMQQPGANVGNYKMNMNYIRDEKTGFAKTSPVARSTPVLYDALKKDLKNDENKFNTDRGERVSAGLENVEETKQFNAGLQAEIDIINKSLSRINSLCTAQKLTQQDPSQSARDISMELKSRQSTSTAKLTKIDESVESMLFQSMSNWNFVVKNLQDTTDFSVHRASHSDTQNSNLLLANLDSSQLDVSQAQSRMQAPSQLSQISVKDDARDLLDKYSQLLVEQIQKKLQMPQQQDPK